MIRSLCLLVPVMVAAWSADLPTTASAPSNGPRAAGYVTADLTGLWRGKWGSTSSGNIFDLVYAVAADGTVTGDFSASPGTSGVGFGSGPFIGKHTLADPTTGKLGGILGFQSLSASGGGLFTANGAALTGSSGGSNLGLRGVFTSTSLGDWVDDSQKQKLTPGFNVSGTWDVTLIADGGTEQKGNVLQWTQTSGVLTGTFSWSSGQRQIVGGYVDGKNVHYDIFDMMGATATMHGTLTGSATSLTGTLVSGKVQGTLRATVDSDGNGGGGGNGSGGGTGSNNSVDQGNGPGTSVPNAGGGNGSNGPNPTYDGSSQDSSGCGLGAGTLAVMALPCALLMSRRSRRR